MPDEIIITSGSYGVVRRQRYWEVRKDQWTKHQQCRLHRKEPKRTPLGWVKIILYYIVLYALITAMILINIQWTFKMIKPGEIKTTSLSSVPGFYKGNVKYIRYREYMRSDIRRHTEKIEGFIKKLGVNVSRHLRECNFDNNWGYTTASPCILLKLNYAINFTVETYNSAITVPKEMPDELYDFILEIPEEYRRNRIWVSCTYMDPKIEEKAKVNYIPHRYYEADGLFAETDEFYLYENLTRVNVTENPNYRRLIGVQFENFPVNEDVYIECRVWGKNIPIELATTVFALHLVKIVIPSNYE
ncbi:CG5250, partial [Drosophila busckii]